MDRHHQTSLKNNQPIAIAVHGGAGAMKPGVLSPKREAQCLEVLASALKTGHAVLQSGGTSVEAVTVAVQILEDSPLFNAGKGAVYTADGHHELDAAIMDGSTRRAGAVAGVTRIQNPIELARLVMENSPHVFLVGHGAERFAEENGVEFIANHFFDTVERLESLQKAQERARAIARGEPVEPLTEEEKHGTVGCVALDCHGNLAAATSTGGMTNKRPGRVGDSPVIGAGTFADNESCAVSATGHGEFFLRWVVAHEIACLMRYAKCSVQAAASDVIHRQLQAAGGTGGVIAIDRNGWIAMPFNTDGMFRGSINSNQELFTAIYR